MQSSTSLTTQTWHFIVHLRLHYQFFILSGGYLLVALFLPEVDWTSFGIQFLNVHVLLFGGATAYNSYWDKDEGPIGGLKSPPKMTDWMWTASLLIQFVGIIPALFAGFKFLVIYISSMLLFWLYSTPLARWKGKPILSVFAIGISTGTNSFLLGYLAGGADSLSLNEGFIAFAVACILVSLYPVSQVFQIEEDKERGDQTFAMKFGLKGVRRFYVVMYLVGLQILSYQLFQVDITLGVIFGALGFLSFSGIVFILFRLKGVKEEYGLVMKIKFLASLSFVAFILSTLLIKSII